MIKTFNSKDRAERVKHTAALWTPDVKSSASADGLPVTRTLMMPGADGETNYGLADNPYNPGDLIDQIPSAIASRYLEHINSTGEQPSQDARALLGITTDKSGKHSFDVRNGLLTHIPSLAHYASIPVVQKDPDDPSSMQGPQNTVVNHYFDSPNMQIGRHPSLDYRLAAGHWLDPSDHRPESILHGNMLWPHDHIATMHDWYVQGMHEEIISDRIEPHTIGTGYHNFTTGISHFFEPLATFDSDGNHTGWHPHNPESDNPMLNSPVPLHHAFERVLRNIFEPESERRSSRMVVDERRSGNKYPWHQQLAKWANTSQFAIDYSPINALAHNHDPRWMVRDMQHVFRALTSSDKTLSDLAQQHYGSSQNAAGNIDFSGMAPRSRWALGNRAWDGPNQAVFGDLKRQLLIVGSDQTRTTRREKVPFSGFDTSTAARIERGASALNNVGGKLFRIPGGGPVLSKPTGDFF